ncbi:MAG: threonine synthase [Bacteroidetes bacterium HGW-Bacteroidetes-22]|nr:MAG: threonine synthase [Bacteroidetes bacterium HGW-Bacteroidetes-22]
MMKYHFRCSDCGTEYHEPFLYLCPNCSFLNRDDRPPAGVLLTVYPYEKIAGKLSGQRLFDELRLQHFLPLLPINSEESLGVLRVGNTPLYEAGHLAELPQSARVLVKDDSQNPTFSFKDRASQLVSAWAKEHDIHTIVTASTGNAGSSLAGICASQRQRAVVFAPATAPPAKLLQMVMYGATTILVNGNYDAAFELSLKATTHFGWFNRNTAYNPFTIEGKKIVAFELFQQTRGELPDYIFVPVGDGVILSGLYKGFEDLLKLGIISHIPIVVAVQSEQSDNLVRNLDADEFLIRPATTIADSISVDVPRNFRMAAGFLKRYDGEHMTVSDESIAIAAEKLARTTGIFTEPAGAAAVAGLLKWIDEGRLKTDETALILATGSGLKDIRTPLKHVLMPKPITPDLDSLIHYLNKTGS